MYMSECSVFIQHQKRASDSIKDGCEPPCGCRELNSGPLKEQLLLLTTELPKGSFLYDGSSDGRHTEKWRLAQVEQDTELAKG